MVVVMNRLRCPASYAEHLVRAFRHAGNLQGVPGFMEFQFLKNQREGEPLEYLALTRWESRAAYEAWTRSESFAAAHPPGGGQSPVTATLELYETVE